MSAPAVGLFYPGPGPPLAVGPLPVLGSGRGSSKSVVLLGKLGLLDSLRLQSSPLKLPCFCRDHGFLAPVFLSKYSAFAVCQALEFRVNQAEKIFALEERAILSSFFG